MKSTELHFIAIDSANITIFFSVEVFHFVLASIVHQFMQNPVEKYAMP